MNGISQYRLSIVNKIIAAFSTSSAAVSFLLIADIFIVTLLQEWMYQMLACFSVDPSRTLDTFKEVHRTQQGANIAIRAGELIIGDVFQQLTLVGYLIYSHICVAVAATLTAARGWAYYFHFVS